MYFIGVLLFSYTKLVETMFVYAVNDPNVQKEFSKCNFYTNVQSTEAMLGKRKANNEVK